MPTTWTIAIDWNRDGDYSDSYEDVTSRVISANWSLGTDKPYVDIAENSLLQLVLSNEDRRYSPENASSPLYGSLKPFRQVRIQSDDGAAVRTHWIGWIETLQPEVGRYGKRTLRITAAGPMLFYKVAESQLALQENVFTDQVLTALIQEVLFPPGVSGAWVLGFSVNGQLGTNTVLGGVTSVSNLPERDPDNPLTIRVAGEEGRLRLAMAADNWVIQGGAADEEQRAFNVYKAMGDIAAAEHGKFLFDREGKALFWNRHHLLDPGTPVATFDDSMTGMAYAFAGIEQIRNEVIVVCHPRAISATATDVLWKLGDSLIQVDPGKTRTFSVHYEDEGRQRVGGKEVVVADVEYQSGQATITVDARANGAEIRIVNRDPKVAAIITKLSLKGRKILDSGEMEAKAISQTSLDDYGRRTLRINLPSIDSLPDAQDIADFECSRRSVPRGEVSAVTMLSHGVRGGDQHVHQLARTLGDLITVRETQAAHDRDYFIVGEAHELTQGATLWKTTWYLEPAPAAPLPWKLGAAGRAEVGSATVLTY